MCSKVNLIRKLVWLIFAFLSIVPIVLSQYCYNGNFPKILGGTGGAVILTTIDMDS